MHKSVVALRFWPAPPGVSNFDDLNKNYGLPVLKQGQDSIEIFATSIANADARRFDRLAKYLMWKSVTVDVPLWIEKCCDGNVSFVDFY